MSTTKHEGETFAERDDRRFLHLAYFCAIALPVIGLLMGLQIVVSPKRSALRDHAVMVIGVSVIAGVAWYFIAKALIGLNHPIVVR